jgi:hypothetical protein
LTNDGGSGDGGGGDDGGGGGVSGGGAGGVNGEVKGDGMIRISQFFRPSGKHSSDSTAGNNNNNANSYTASRDIDSISSSIKSTGTSSGTTGLSTLPDLITGNWGCGAFGGDPELKFLLQWLAASQAGGVGWRWCASFHSVSYFCIPYCNAMLKYQLTVTETFPYYSTASIK